MRKIWNFAMAAIVIVASAGLLVACDKDDLGTDNPWSNGEYEFAETDLSFTDVLTSAEFWYANFTETVRYTEPNGKGKSYGYSSTPDGGSILPGISVMLDDLRLFHHETALVGVLPSFYRDIPYRIEEDMIIFKPEVVEPNNANAYFGNPLYEGEYYFKILDYDETKVLVETNYNQVTISGTKYPYMITVLHKREIPNYSYVPFEEWLKVFEELENK